MQILDIVLYSRDGRIRTVSLRPGALNIVTGASSKGKSALLDVIDYCLGSGDFRVPGVIRRSVSWFGLRLQLPASQAFIARPNPSPSQKITSDICLDIGRQVAVPAMRDLATNANTEALQDFLDSQLGIVENAEVKTFDREVPANVRHALLLCFQGQNEIANKAILFHRQGDPFVSHQTVRVEGVQNESSL